MKRIITISFIALLAISFTGFAQDISNSTKEVHQFGQIHYAPTDATTITHSVDPITVTVGTGVACTTGGITSDNQYWRSFVLADFAITDDYSVTNVEFGIEDATAGIGGTQPMTVNLYTTDLVFPTGTLTLIGTLDVMVPDQALTLYQIPVTGTAPAGSELVVEISIPADVGDGNVFYPGANSLGETADSWISSAGCGILTPVTYTSIGFATCQLVMSVTGDVGGGGTMDKLLLTEFVVTPTGGEFIEIFNPNASPVDLTNYFVSDVAFDGGPEYYYHVVWGLYEGSFGDFMSKFPDGATIGAGEHQIIALNGDADFFSTYAVNPTYEIDQAEFQFGPPDGIPDMMETHPGSIYGADSTHNPGLTNGDEMVMLFYWDGNSDLVGDVDYVLYNSASPIANNEFVDKTGITIDGPDPGTTGSTYLDDTPEANQLSALSPTSGFSTQRLDYTEGLQVMSGGNGVTGSDETSEDMNNTWIVDVPTPFVAIPVELTSFTVQASGVNVTLNWSTATETNNQGFEVQRSTNNQFTTIGFVNGFGTTTEIHSYSYTDNSLQVGTYSYRLKQIDYDGTFEYSDVVEVDVTVPKVFALEQNYPNPFNPSTMIKFSLAADSKVSLTVFDVLGQEVSNLISGNLAAGLHEINFNASNINSGVYFYRIDATAVDGTNFSSVKKMILTK